MQTSTSRQQFMNFFRDTEQLNQLFFDDRLEVYSTILTGSSDFTKELLDEVLSDYSVSHLEIVETNEVETLGICFIQLKNEF